MRIVPDGDGITYVMQSNDSPELYAIVTQHMPQWADLFARKNADYGDGAKVLGVRGQYADINRKMLKLKRALWDGELLEFEGADEVIMDLIGHLFLTLYMIRFREDTERQRLFGKEDDATFVDKFIDELGGPEQALRIGGLLSEALSSQITARCHERASEGFYEPEAGAPVDPDDAEHSAREAVRRYDRDVATPAVVAGISINEYEAAQQEAMARRLCKGTDERLLSDYPGGARQAILDHKSAPRDGFVNRSLMVARLRDPDDELIAAMSMEAEGGFDRPEFAEADARQHGVGRSKDTLPHWLYERFGSKHSTFKWDAMSDGDRTYWAHEAAAIRRAVARNGFKHGDTDASEELFEEAYAAAEEADVERREATEGDTGRIVTEQQNGVTRYFHEAYPGSDREPLSLVPSALIGRLEKDHYVLSQDTKGGLQELAKWAERTR